MTPLSWPLTLLPASLDGVASPTLHHVTIETEFNGERVKFRGVFPEGKRSLEAIAGVAAEVEAALRKRVREFAEQRGK